MDYLTKWPEVFATSDQTSLTIAELLVKNVISHHGVPAELLLSTVRTAFLSKLMINVYQLLGILGLSAIRDKESKHNHLPSPDG